MLSQWPMYIYLESSILFKLPLHVVNAEIEQLRDLSEKIGIEIFIPRVSLEEWLYHRNERIRQHISHVEDGLGSLSKLFDYVNDIVWKKNKEEIISEAKEITKAILKTNNISIIETPKIDLEEMVNMSVNKIAPFEQHNEKGFRDSLILFTILEHAKQNNEYAHILVARDGIYKHTEIKKITDKYGVNLVITESLVDTIILLKDFLQKMHKTFQAYKEGILKKFLMENEKKIIEYIKVNGEFTKSSLGLFLIDDLYSIDDLQIVNIPIVTRGTLPKDINEGKVQVSFTVEVDFTLTIMEYVQPSESKFKIGQSPALADYLSLLSGATSSLNVNKQLNKRTTKLEIPLEGSVLLKREHVEKGIEDRYYDLEINALKIDRQ